MLTLIKMGGSVITDKKKFMTAKKHVIDAIAGEIGAYEPEKNETIWVLHGAGSFGHHSAQKFFALPKDEQTFARVQQIQAEVDFLNNRVGQCLDTHEFLAEKMHPRDVWLDERIWETTMQKKHPIVMHGDMIWDENEAKVLSTEEILVRICESKNEPTRVLLLCDTAGVLDAHGNVMTQLNETIEPTKNDTPDVTGGMGTKILHSLAMAKTGANVTIASGKTPGLVADWLRHEPVVGTQLGLQ
jgi:isopentenyl phosphate kinase